MAFAKGAGSRPAAVAPPGPVPTLEVDTPMSTVEAIRSIEDATRERNEAGAAVVNVGDTERLLSQVGGGLLVGVGLLRGGLKGVTLAALGGVLLHRGTTGHCSLFQ